MVKAVEKAEGAEHGLVQLPPRAGGDAGQAAHRRGQARARSSTTAPTFCRTGRSAPTCRRAAPGLWRLDVAAAGSRRHRRPARPLHRHRHLAQRLDQQRHRDDRDVHQGAQAHPHRQGGEGRHRRRLRVPVPLRQRLARRCSNRPATPAATRRCTPSKSTARTPRIKWDLHDLHRLQYFDHKDEGTLRGWRSIHVTDGDQPYMKQLVGAGPADRLRAHLRPPGGGLPRRPGERQAVPRRRSATRWRRRRCAMRFWSGGRVSGRRLGQHDKWRVAPFVDKN